MKASGESSPLDGPHMSHAHILNPIPQGVGRNQMGSNTVQKGLGHLLTQCKHNPLASFLHDC